MRKLKKIESINNKKPWLANTVLLLLLPLSRQSQAKIDRQTEEQKIGAFRSLSFVVCLALLSTSSIHRCSILSGRCLLAHVAQRDTLLVKRQRRVVPERDLSLCSGAATMADTASTLNFGPQWLHKQFSVPDANGGGGGHGGGGTGPAAFHVGRSGDHRGGGGGGGKIPLGYVTSSWAMRRLENVTVT